MKTLGYIKFIINEKNDFFQIQVLTNNEQSTESLEELFRSNFEIVSKAVLKPMIKCGEEIETDLFN